MPSASGDNTALGYGYQPQRIGLRGAGNVSWAYLTKTYPNYYTTTTLTSPLAAAVPRCRTLAKPAASLGLLRQCDESHPGERIPTPALVRLRAHTGSLFRIAAAADRRSEWPHGAGVYSRSSPNAAIFCYSLTITQDGLLSLSSRAGRKSLAYTSIIRNRSIAATNAIPSLPEQFCTFRLRRLLRRRHQRTRDHVFQAPRPPLNRQIPRRSASASWQPKSRAARRSIFPTTTRRTGPEI